ncbi:MAG: SDR family NAD(P)-dependent oxidoreductase [Calditrichaeota bacterium]|nr:SDR family NAD(P)-dependent oxidoreductase [Calditrichota bacterium]
MKVLLTGGSGFLGSELCKELLEAGHDVVVLDDHSRGRSSRLECFGNRVQLVEGNVRDYDTVKAATEGCEVVWHLAYINGTRFFYEKPDIVLEVGIKGTLNTIEAALACGVRRYVLASTSETYNNPTQVPTTESERLMIPDITNPRFSYGGGKIACELLTLHYGGFRGLETVIFRPHNFIGPDMGFEHVIPDITGRIVSLSCNLTKTAIDLPIQGDGSETRSFCDVIDGAHGCYLAGEFGENGQIYHVGKDEEVTIRHLVESIGKIMGVQINLVPGELRAGGTPRRCPSIEKLRGLGYDPQYNFDKALERCVHWYTEYYIEKANANGIKK